MHLMKLNQQGVTFAMDYGRVNMVHSNSQEFGNWKLKAYIIECPVI